MALLKLSESDALAVGVDDGAEHAIQRRLDGRLGVCDGDGTHQQRGDEGGA